MKDAKTIAFYKEFPFLEKLLNVDEAWNVCVKRVDYDLLTSKPCYNDSFLKWFLNGDWIGGEATALPYSPLSAFALLDENGKILTFVGLRWWNPITWARTRETVGDVITRLGDRAKRVFFVVNFSPQGDHPLTVYKPPRGFTIQDWLEEETRRKRAAFSEEVRREQEAIRAEAAAIDALADQK